MPANCWVSFLPVQLAFSSRLTCLDFADWLVSRRHCGKDWMKSLTQIRQMILQALRDMPENEAIAQILSSGSRM